MNMMMRRLAVVSPIVVSIMRKMARCLAAAGAAHALCCAACCATSYCTAKTGAALLTAQPLDGGDGLLSVSVASSLADRRCLTACM